MRMGYKFKGWDWTELCEALGISAPAYLDNVGRDHPKTSLYPAKSPFILCPKEEYLLEETKKFLSRSLASNSPDRENVIKLCRRMVQSQNEDEYLSPGGYAALASNILDDESFVSFIITNLQFFWT